MALTDAQLERYSRHLILKQIGVKGQKALLSSKVLVIGAGGLGSPVLSYLAAAGVGTLGICDGDVVSLSNLQRQILYTTDEIGQPKVECAKRRLSAMNPDVTFELYDYYLTPDNIMDIIARHPRLLRPGPDRSAGHSLLPLLLPRPAPERGLADLCRSRCRRCHTGLHREPAGDRGREVPDRLRNASDQHAPGGPRGRHGVRAARTAGEGRELSGLWEALHDLKGRTGGTERLRDQRVTQF